MGAPERAVIGRDGKARNYSKVHTDINRLEELGLVERTEDNQVSVPYESVQILVPLAQVA